MALITLEDVEVNYGSFRALDGVSLEIGEGAVGLLGPNGAGKSTLMKTLLGFNRATRGTVTVMGHAMPGHALQVRQRLGYMPEREVVSPRVSAVSFLTYVGRLCGMNQVDATERTHEVLNYAGLGESRYRKMESYSTGMLQRVKLAQALIHDPKLLLLDEPTNGLDPDGRIEMLELIREVAAQRGVTIVLSSHLLPDVQHVCDRIIMIAGGTIRREGTIESFTAVHGDHYEVRVRGVKEAFTGGLDAAAFTWKELPNGNLLVALPAGTEARAIFEVARAQQSQIRHFQPARHSLAEVFVEAMAGEGESA